MGIRRNKVRLQQLKRTISGIGRYSFFQDLEIGEEQKKAISIGGWLRGGKGNSFQRGCKEPAPLRPIL